MATLFMLAFPMLVLAAVIAMVVGLVMGFKKMFASFGSRSPKESVKPTNTAPRGATYADNIGPANVQWNESPDYSQYESPAFLRMQLA
ncbi:hypothetical protein LCGC14_1012050 [marine sediment metagenome]|uniref:Uncharacterized protein n=1 Tax=marine sediment metagenome TaxID=412755 RepID=A0A0F9R639_9ZZZZ